MTAQTVSVLIPTFNRAVWLTQSLDSILAQTRRPDEIIVINDGSTDDTLERLEPYGPHIRIINQDNAGKSAALNRGLAAATGDLIWVFDDDDLATHDALEKLLKLLARNPEAGFAYGRHNRFETRPNGKTRWRSTGYWRNCPPEDFLFESLLDMFAHQPGILVKKSLFERAGPFDETLIRSQDYEMLLRLAVLARPASTERIVFHQRQHDLPRGTAKQVICGEDRMRVWQKYDRQIFQRLAGSLPLGKYLPANCQLTAPGATRRALIRRGIVMTRKCLLSQASEDFHRAATIAERSLSREEAADLRKMLMFKYGCDKAEPDPQFCQMLFSVKSTSAVGAEISSVVARALVWRVRHALQRGKFLMAFRLASLIIGLSMPRWHEAREASSSYVRR